MRRFLRFSFLRFSFFRFTRDDISAYILIAPFFLFFIVFIIAPIFYNAHMSLTNATGLGETPDFIFFDNYIKLFKDATFLKALKNTGLFALFGVLPAVVLGLLAAVALNSRLKIIAAARGLFVFPYISSMVSISMIWLVMFEPNHGVLNKLLAALVISPKKWLFDVDLAIWCLIFVNIWKNMGFAMLVFLSGLQGVDPGLSESAKVDGASDFAILRKIIIPLLRPISIFVFVTSVIEAFKTFDQVRVMTDGNPLLSTTTVVHQIYLKAFAEFKYGYAASMSIVLLAIIFVATLINMKLTGFWKGGAKN